MSLQLHNVSQARYRVCLFINQVLQQLHKKDEGIDATLSENIKEVMLERMQVILNIQNIFIHTINRNKLFLIIGCEISRTNSSN